MSKHRVLSLKPQLRLEWRGQDGQNETEQPDHSASLGDSITSSTQIRFSVHTTVPTRRSPLNSCLTGKPATFAVSTNSTPSRVCSREILPSNLATVSFRPPRSTR